MSPVLDIQRRFMQLGRVRLGEKGPKGEPKKLSTFRFTSPSEALLEEVAAKYGGTVRAWEGAPDDGYFEITTRASEMDIILPPAYDEIDGTPGVRYSQWYEAWSAGGCQRRCDGVTEQFSQEPCLCAAAGQNGKDRTCKLTSRVSFMLPGSQVGVWRLDTHSYYAAVEAPAMLDFLKSGGAEGFIPAILRIENRTRKVGNQTRKFIVPVIEFPRVTIPEIDARGEVNLALNAPPALPKRGERAALPAAPVLEASAEFDNGSPPLGEPPDIEPSDEPLRLALELADLAEKLGAREATEHAILKNKDMHEAVPEKHVAWLRRQITTARKNLEAQPVVEPEPGAELQDSFFAQAAAEAQRKRGK